MFNNWCWAHWIVLACILVSIPVASINQYNKDYDFPKALWTFALGSVIAIIKVYLLHVGGFW